MYPNLIWLLKIDLNVCKFDLFYAFIVNVNWPKLLARKPSENTLNSSMNRPFFSAFLTSFSHPYINKINSLSLLKVRRNYSCLTRGRQRFYHYWQVRYSDLKLGHISVIISEISAVIPVVVSTVTRWQHQ